MTNDLAVVMVGGTGAVGGQAARVLAGMKEVRRLTLLGRRTVEGLAGSVVSQAVVDIFQPGSYQHLLGGHRQAVCTLGVGQPSKVSKAEFVAVDKDAVIGFATACKTAGVQHFELLGSVAADPKASSFYLRTKGELREALVALNFERLSIFQPSVILTPTNRYDIWQGLLLAAWPRISVLLPGTWRKYRGIRVDTLGTAMAKNLLTDGGGTEILEWDEFQRVAIIRP